MKVGDIVKQGQVVGRCGNSGRSPYPHLHFQFQATPYIGSITLDYPFGHFLLKDANKYSLKAFEFPQKDQVVANPLKNAVLSKALHFIPGQRLSVNVEVESEKEKWKKQAGAFTWLVETDVFNTTYIRCEKDNGLAYLYNNGDLHYFTNFTGTKNTALYWFFMALFKVPLGFLPNSKITDSIQLNMMFGGVLKFLQDFVAPIFLFLKVDYDLSIKDSGDILSSGDLSLSALITKKIAGRKIKEYNCDVNVSHEGAFNIFINFDEAKIKIICQNELD